MNGRPSGLYRIEVRSPPRGDPEVTCDSEIAHRSHTHARTSPHTQHPTGREPHISWKWMAPGTRMHPMGSAMQLPNGHIMGHFPYDGLTVEIRPL